VGGGKAALEAGDVEDAALDIHLLQHQAAGLADPEPITKHQQDQTAVSGVVETDPDGVEGALEFPARGVLGLSSFFESWEKGGLPEPSQRVGEQVALPLAARGSRWIEAGARC